MYNCPDSTINNIKIWYVHFIMQLSVTATLNNTFDKLVWLNKPVTNILLFTVFTLYRFPSIFSQHNIFIHKFIGVRKEVNDHQVDVEMKNPLRPPATFFRQKNLAKFRLASGNCYAGYTYLGDDLTRQWIAHDRFYSENIWRIFDTTRYTVFFICIHRF